MVKKYPATIEECKRRREKVPVSELKFFNLVDALDDNWHVWHSIKWDNDTKMQSGEADFLIFNPNLGFVVVEVKGGIISIEIIIFILLRPIQGKNFPSINLLLIKQKTLCIIL